jgi:3-hydroxybutyryl-CoA dehydratase
MNDAHAGYFFEDLSIGMSAEISRTVSSDDIDQFASAVGDFNPIHVDEEWAQQTRFKGRIAHGMLTGGLISSVLGTRLPGLGTVYVRQTLEFHAPVRPGTVVNSRVCITRLDPTRNRVYLDTTCICEGTTVLSGEAVLLVKSRARPI